MSEYDSSTSSMVLPHYYFFFPQNISDDILEERSEFIFDRVYSIITALTMSHYITSLSPPLPIIDGTFAEISHVLSRASIAGAFGLGAGPMFFRKRKSPPMWRTAMLGSSALASCSVPFLCMERLAYHSLISSVSSTSIDTSRYVLYVSHTLGTILGAGVLHVARKTKGRFVVPFQVLGPMLCKAQIETILLRKDAH